jgi:hypothetical protein
MEEQQKQKSGWNALGEIARRIANNMNNQKPQRPRNSAPKPRKPCGGCGGK